MFDRSLAKRLRYRPFRTDEAGNVTQTLDGVFILLSRELVDMLKDELTAAERDELEGFVFVVDQAQAALWNVPVWAGEESAVYIRVPAAVWNDPTGDPPAKVKRFFHNLWRELSQ